MKLFSNASKIVQVSFNRFLLIATEMYEVVKSLSLKPVTMDWNVSAHFNDIARYTDDSIFYYPSLHQFRI